MKIFQLIKLLYEDKAEYSSVIEIFKDEINEQSTNNIQVNINKYINTLKIFGMKIVKENHKFKLLSSLYSLDMNVEDLKSLAILVNTANNFPDKNLTGKVNEFVKSIENKEITFCSGPAGSGKTFMALWTALKLLEKNQFEQIILAKSVTSIPGEEIGILPGDIYEKMDPFLISFFGNIDKLIGEEERKRLIKENKIKIQPLMYIRGINIDKSIVILDEA